MPANLRRKPRKLNKDFAERRWWRTSSALLSLPALPLSTGLLGCTMSCTLVQLHSEWKLDMFENGAVCLFSTFLFSVFSMLHFLSAFCVVALQISTCKKIASLFLILWIALYIQPRGQPKLKKQKMVMGKLKSVLIFSLALTVLGSSLKDDCMPLVTLENASINPAKSCNIT